MKIRRIAQCLVIILTAPLFLCTGCGKKAVQGEVRYNPGQVTVTLKSEKLKQSYPEGNGTITVTGRAETTEGEDRDFEIPAPGFYRYDRQGQTITIISADEELVSLFDENTSITASITVSLDTGGMMERQQKDFIFPYERRE